MAENRSTLEAFTSPIGSAVFPWITKADTRFNAEGVFKTQISVPFEDAQAFIVKLEKARDDFIATLDPQKQASFNAVPVYEEEYTRPDFPADATDAEKDAIRKDFVPEPTGNVLFKFKLNARVTPRDETKDAFDQKPIVVSAEDGAAVDKPVYMGSVIRIKGQIAPYTNAMSKSAGVTLRMKAVQVLELVSGGSGEGSSFWTDFDDS
jgi:hypothetical protein